MERLEKIHTFISTSFLLWGLGLPGPRIFGGFMQIIEKCLKDLRPYEKNPRNNDGAVDYVAESIRSYGFKVPIVIDKNGVIVAGHTRYKAAEKILPEE